MLKKKNNKGFSLVELIVVILIMAIIAVALAPQVMKWVNNSRIATDVSNYDSMVSSVQLALATEGGTSISGTVTIESTGTTVTTVTTGTTVTGGALESALKKILPDYANVKAKAKVSPDEYDIYVITVTNGVVERKDAPDGSKVN